MKYLMMVTFLLLSSCNILSDSTSIADTPTPEVYISLTQAIPSQEVSPTITSESPTIQPTAEKGMETTYGVLSLVIPPSIADGASGSEFPSVDSDDAAYWQKTPGHLQVMLGEYYLLKGKSLEPQIYVFPAQEYAELVPSAFENIHRLNNILENAAVSINADQLPTVPFFNAQQVFASNVQPISFQNGKGIRFLSEYAQYPAPANNNDLFYQFQGLTNDGAYYIVAIFPTEAPGLADNSELAVSNPIEGISFPQMGDPQISWTLYYDAVTSLLNGTPSDGFTPALSQLDLLIQSMQINP